MRHRHVSSLRAAVVRRACLAALVAAWLAAFAIDKAVAAGAASAPARASAASAPKRAAAPAKRAAAASAPARKGILTPAQLQACLKQKDDLNAKTDEAVKDKAALAAERTEIANLGTALADEVSTLDRTDADQVAEYNAKVASRDKAIDAYQTKVTAFNNKADAVNTAKDAYLTDCAERRYDEQDLPPTPKQKK